jgi:hypothetical protein
VSRLPYQLHGGQIRWSVNLPFFVVYNFQNGLAVLRHQANMGVSWASVLLGPDLAMPGQLGNNPPAGNWPGFNAPWPPPQPRPALQFNQDINVGWIQGHLINGQWGGPGNHLVNLTPPH